MFIKLRKYIHLFRFQKDKLAFYFVVLSFVFSLSACQYDFPEASMNYKTENLDLSSFVCVGDDFLSGFMNGALYDAGQHNSVAAIIAENLEKTGLPSFNQGNIYSLNGYNEYASDKEHIFGRYVYMYPDNQSTEPIIVTTPGEEVQPFTEDKNLLNDFSVPFMRIFQIDDPLLDTNKYYHRIATEPSVSTLLSQIEQVKPTFFILWTGMSDILGYATTGGVGDSLPNPSQITAQDLTPVNVFQEKVDLLVSSLLKQPNSKGVILSLPEFDDLPYFYYYVYNFIKLPGTRLGLAEATYREFNEAVSQNNMNLENPKRPYISFNDNGATPYPQAFVVRDQSLPDAFYPDGSPLEKIRQLHENEMALMGLPRDLLQYGLGSLIPLSESYYLDEARIRTIRLRVHDFNNILLRKVQEYPHRLIFVDLTESIHEIAETGKLNGWGRPASDEAYDFNGVPLSGRLELNSIYSLDGLHFNQRGDAFVANEVIHSINQMYQCTIPEADVNAYKGNVPLY